MAEKTKISPMERAAQLRKLADKIVGNAKKKERKERDGQLIALGVLSELIIKTQTAKHRDKLAALANELLANDERNLARVKAAFARLTPASAPGKSDAPETADADN